MSTIATPRPIHHLSGQRVVMAGRSRVRWDRVLTLLLALVVVGWFLGATAMSSQADVSPAAPITVVVQPGDTLWDLARAHAPAGVATMEYVMRVEADNGVRAAVLLPGSVLRLPQD